MRKIAAAVAVCGLAFAGVGATSAAAPSSFDTQIDVLGADSAPTGFIVFGVLESEKKKCRQSRDWKAIAKTNAPKRAQRGDILILDTGTSSENGGWAFHVEQKFLGQLKLKVAAKTLSSGDLCKGATESINL
jgi:hypothetical protein